MKILRTATKTHHSQKKKKKIKHWKVKQKVLQMYVYAFLTYV